MWKWYYENHPNNPDLDNENDEQLHTFQKKTTQKK